MSNASQPGSVTQRTSKASSSTPKSAQLCWREMATPLLLRIIGHSWCSGAFELGKSDGFIPQTLARPSALADHAPSRSHFGQAGVSVGIAVFAAQIIKQL